MLELIPRDFQMAEFTVIKEVTEALRELLRAHITQDPGPQLNGVPIDLRSPKEMREASNAKGISLWLYRVVRNRDLLNSPPERPTPTQTARRPLPVDLYYLVTPIAVNPTDEQVLMGRVLQTFNDHALLRQNDLGAAFSENVELRLMLETPPVEEQTRIWHALSESYQLSVTYLVQLLSIDSAHEPLRTSPVFRRDADYRQILSVE